MTKADGRRYEGRWHGMMDGHGVMTWPDGRLFEGEWQEGVRRLR